MKKGKTKLIFILILIVLFAGYGVYTSLNHVKYSAEGEKICYIDDENDFYEYIENANVYEKAVLESDITLSNEHDSIGPKNQKFSRVFDGQGYTITLTEDAVSIPLFDTIDTLGVVKNLEINVNKCEVSTISYGILAIQNKGKISNCILTVGEFIIKCDSVAGVMVGVNDGEISYCYIKSKIINQITKSRKESIISGVCAFNFGEIKYAISDVLYEGFEGTNYDNILNGKLNNSIGAVYGINNANKEKVVNNYYISLISQNVVDAKEITNMVDSKLYLDEGVLLNSFHFNNRIWKMEVIDKTNYLFNISLEDGVSI